MKKSPIFERDKKIESCFKADADIILYHGDVNDFLETVPDHFVNLIISSPPYNLGKKYEKQVNITEYLEAQSQTLKQFYRILKDTGSICWQVGNYVKDGEVFPLDIFYYAYFFKENYYESNAKTY